MLAEIWELWPYLRPYRFKFIGGLFLGLMAAGFGLALPYLIGVIVDAVATENTRRALPGWTPDAGTAGRILIVALVAQGACIYLHFYWVATAGQRAVATLRGAVFERLVRQRMGFFAEIPSLFQT